MQLEDIDFNAEDLRKILAKFLKEKYKDIDAADAKDLLNAIKIYVDKFGDSGEDGVAKFNRHFIQVYPPYNAVCPNCGKEIDLPRGVNSKMQALRPSVCMERGKGKILLICLFFCFSIIYLSF